MWWWSGVALAGGACDPAAVAKVHQALFQVEAAIRPDLAAAGVAEACAGTPLAETAGGLGAADPRQRQTVDLQLALTDLAGWVAACPGGPGALAEAAKGANARAALWEPCALAATGWFLEDEWTGGAGLLVTPLVAGHHLAASGVPPFQVRAVVRALAGAPLGAPDGAGPRLADALVPAQEVGSPRGAAPAAAEGVAGFAEGGRVKPEWSKAAEQAGGACTVTIGVTPEGALRKLTWTDCPEALRKDVEKAIGRSTLAPATRDGAPVPGRFDATYKVR